MNLYTFKVAKDKIQESDIDTPRTKKFKIGQFKGKYIKFNQEKTNKVALSINPYLRNVTLLIFFLLVKVNCVKNRFLLS